MDTVQLKRMLEQVEGGLQHTVENERAAELELARRRDARLRQEGAVLLLRQLMQEGEANNQESDNA